MPQFYEKAKPVLIFLQSSRLSWIEAGLVIWMKAGLVIWMKAGLVIWMKVGLVFWMKIGLVPQFVGDFNVMQNLFHTVIKGHNLSVFIKNTLTISLCSDT